MTTPVIEKDAERVDERTMPPFLRRVRIRGYRSIAFCDVALHPLTILVGRNGAGKSNFLDALAFLRDIMATNVSEAVKRRGGWSSLLCRTAKVSGIEFEVEVGFHWSAGSAPDEGGKVQAIARYRLRVEADERSIPTITSESLDLQSDPPGESVGFTVTKGAVSDSTAGPHPSRLPRSINPDYPLLGMIGAWHPNRLGDGFRYMGFYNFHPEAIRRPQPPMPGVLESDGSNLAGAIVGLKAIDEESLDRIRDYLALVNEDVLGVDVATYGPYQTVKFDLRGSSLSKPLQFDAANMSDGTLRALAILVAAFQINLPIGPDVVGIEEPETSLHPAAMRALVDAMDEATQRTQIILTTHSADLLAGRDLSPGQVLIVRNRKGQTHITPVDRASREIIEKELYSLADLQRMDRLDLDEADLKRQAQIGNGTEGA